MAVVNNSKSHFFLLASFIFGHFKDYHFYLKFKICDGSQLHKSNFSLSAEFVNF